MPTASAVVADMIDTAVGRTRLTFKTLALWSNEEARVNVRDHADVLARYYLRLSVEDSPNSAGVAIDSLRCAKLALERGEGGDQPVDASGLDDFDVRDRLVRGQLHHRARAGPGGQGHEAAEEEGGEAVRIEL